MAEVEMIAIGVLGVALFAALWVLANRENGIDKEAIRLVAGEVVTLSRREYDIDYDERDRKIDSELTRRDEAHQKLVAVQKSMGDVQMAQASALEGVGRMTQRVADALGGNDPDVKRVYGEGRAEQILTRAGLRVGTEFLKQPPLAPYEGNDSGSSPDYALLNAEGGATAIDCKAILKAGFNACYLYEDEEDADKRQALLQQHALDVWGTVKELAERNYPLGLAAQFGQGPRFTLMFIPMEEFYYRAERGVTTELRRSMGVNTLQEAAMTRRVLFVSERDLAIRAINVIDGYKQISIIEDTNDVLDLMQDLVEALVDRDEFAVQEQLALESLIEAHNSRVRAEESDDGRRRLSVRQASKNLFGKVESKQIQTGRGKKGLPKAPVSLEEISTTIETPKGIDLTDIPIDSRLAPPVEDAE